MRNFLDFILILLLCKMATEERAWFERVYFFAGVTYKKLLQFEQEHAVGEQKYDFIPQPAHLLYVFPLCIVMYFLKKYLQAAVFPRLGIMLGCPPRSDKVRFIQKKSIYRQLYEENRRALRSPQLPNELMLNKTLVSTENILKQLGIDEKCLSNRLRKVHNVLSRHTALEKFCDCSWRFFFYFTMFCYGAVVLRKVPWLTDTEHCWEEFPYQLISYRIYFYYIIQMSFYMALCICHFTDVRRKDFWQMFIHHVVTLGLMYNSYMSNTVRIGTLVLLLHDSADILLDLAKMFRYCTRLNLSNATLGLFVFVWLVTRLYLYPVYILAPLWRMSLYYPVTIYDGPVLWYLLGLLTALQVMHIMWTCMIVQSVYLIVRYGESGKDARSDSEPEELSEGELGPAGVTARNDAHGDSNGNLIYRAKQTRANAEHQAEANGQVASGEKEGSSSGL